MAWLMVTAVAVILFNLVADRLGRDYFSRVLFGTRTSLQVAIIVSLFATIIGSVIGALAGYYRGWVDAVLMRFTDLVLTLPGLAVLLVASALLGQGDPIKIAFILAGLYWVSLARIVRGTFLSLREKEYVEAARASGSGDFRIMLRHMLPNALGPIIVNATLVIATAILVEAGDVDTIFHNPRHPYTLGLISSLPRLDQDLTHLAPIPGQPPSLISLPSGCAFHPRCRLLRGRERCVTDLPPLEQVDAAGHRSACHFADEMEQEVHRVEAEIGAEIEAHP